MGRKERRYIVYGHDRGSREKPRYLFTVRAMDAEHAMGAARYRVKYAKVIDRVQWVR